MDSLLQLGFSNAAAATLLALLAVVVSRQSSRPALAHGLWLLVLLKLVTPPLFRVAVPLPASVNATPNAARRGAGRHGFTWIDDLQRQGSNSCRSNSAQSRWPIPPLNNRHLKCPRRPRQPGLLRRRQRFLTQLWLTQPP